MLEQIHGPDGDFGHVPGLRPEMLKKKKTTVDKIMLKVSWNALKQIIFHFLFKFIFFAYFIS